MLHVLLALGAFIMVFPFVWMILTSFKDIFAGVPHPAEVDSRSMGLGKLSPTRSRRLPFGPRLLQQHLYFDHRGGGDAAHRVDGGLRVCQDQLSRPRAAVPAVPGDDDGAAAR